MRDPATEMIRWGKLLFARHLISGWGGNLSCRVSQSEFLITGRHAPLAFLTREDLVKITADGKPLNQAQQASSETPMHTAIYVGTDAQTIIHVHPPLVIAFSLTHDSFVPVSFEEKYTIGEIPIIPQDTPTVTQPHKVVEELKYHPVVIIKGHGTVAIGKTFQEAFLLTDLLEEAVRCQFFKAGISPVDETSAKPSNRTDATEGGKIEQNFALFSTEHMTALVDQANQDAQFRQYGSDTGLSTSLTLLMDEQEVAWTVRFVDGEIVDLQQNKDGEFLISGKAEWWHAVFSNKIDAFLATQQGKLKLARGELAQLSRWYKPFQRAFALWQTIPTH